MKSILTTAVILLCISYLSGQNKINSKAGGKAYVYKNPDYSTRKFSKILVLTNNINNDKSWEDKILKNFERNGINVIGELDLLPPIKKYSDNEIKQICEKNNVDGIISIKLNSKDFSSYNTFSSTTSSSPSSSYNSYSATTLGTLGTVDLQRIHVEFTLYDIKTGQKAAVIQGNTRLRSASTNLLLKRFIRMVANNLKRQGVLE